MPLQVVYVLTNPAMPGLIKIGKTQLEDVGQRLKQLYTTGVPFPFELAFACKVPNADDLEQAFHFAFGNHRVNPSREFFKIEPERVIALLKFHHVEDATAELANLSSDISSAEIQAGERFKARRPNLNFREVGIPIGAVLQFTETDAFVTVTGDKKVSLDGNDMSLTAATRKLLNLEYSVQPSPYWTYDGRSLRSIYDETYEYLG